MLDKVVVMTGATSGIGEVAAAALAAQGARLVIVARDGDRANSTLSLLRSKGPGREHRAVLGDLSEVAETRRVAAEIAASEPRIDVLVNNAGALFWSRLQTREGFERTFALNHLSYFVFTLALEQTLRASGSARVVNTASAAHRGNALDFDDLQAAKRYKGFQVYGRSKLCNILFTRELARRWAATGITVNCLHPGFVATRFGDQSGGLGALGVRAAKLFAISPERGARTIVYLASSPDVAGQSGGYYYECRLDRPSRQARDDAAASRLWSETQRLLSG